MKEISKKYYRFRDSTKKIDAILSYTKNIHDIKEHDRAFSYILELEYIQKNGIYIQHKSVKTISALRTRITDEVKSIDFDGDRGTSFELCIRGGLNVRGYGLFPYFASLILKDTIDFSDDVSGYFISFPDRKLAMLNQYEHEDGNYIRRNIAYRKLGFKIAFDDESEKTGRLENTPVSSLKLNIMSPKALSMLDEKAIKGLFLNNRSSI